MNRVYVYYRVAPALAPSLRGKLQELFAGLAASSGVQGKLARRSEDPDTWMEIYEPVPDPASFLALLVQMAEEHGLARQLAPGSTRRIECFEDVD